MGYCISWQSFLYRKWVLSSDMRMLQGQCEAGKQKSSFSVIGINCTCMFRVLARAYRSKWERANPSWKCGKPVQVHGWSEQDKKPCLILAHHFEQVVDSLALSIYFDLVSVFKNRLCLTVLSNIVMLLMQWHYFKLWLHLGSLQVNIMYGLWCSLWQVIVWTKVFVTAAKRSNFQD